MEDPSNLPQTTQDTIGHSGDISSAYTTTDTSTTVAQTTVFRDSKASEALVAEVPVSQTEDLDFTHSIIQVLARPTLIDDFNVVTTGATMPIFDNARGPIRSYRLPHDILQKGAKILKVANFEFIKCNMVVKIMTNANPFVAGRYWICYSPYEERKLFPHRCINKTRAAVTSYPGVELDLQTNNSITIQVPWSDLRDNGSLTSDFLNELQLHIFTLSPISAVGAFNVNFQVFGWLEDVELRGSTAFGPLIIPTVRANLQIGKEAKGPISEIASTVGTVATALSGIPIIGDVAKTVSWVSSAVGSVASMFGFSKPIEGSGAMPIVNIPARAYGHTKATDASVVLGLANDNAVSEAQMNFMTDQDEMAIEYISNRPGVVSIGTWLDNAIPSAIIAVIPVGPQVTTNRLAVVPAGTVIDLTNFEYISSQFARWRADICFRLSIVKTPFHAGRIEVAFVPGHDKTIDNTTDLTNCYRQILDIANDTEMTVNVPYVSPYPMCGYQPRNSGLDPQNEAPGYLVIRVLSPLVHPDTVSAAIQVIIWKWATNVALAGPGDYRFRSITPPAPFKDPVKAILQVAGVGNVSSENNLLVYQAMNSRDKNLEIAQLVSGELLVSARALTRAHRRKPTAVTPGEIIRTTVSDETGGYVSAMANLFCFWRGGLAYKLYNPLVNTTPDVHMIRTQLQTQTLTTAPNLNPMSHTTYTNLNPFHEVNIPYYACTRRSLTNDILTAAPNPAVTSIPGVLVTSDLPTLDMLVAGKDDFTMGFLYGVGAQYYPGII